MNVENKTERINVINDTDEHSLLLEDLTYKLSVIDYDVLSSFVNDFYYVDSENNIKAKNNITNAQNSINMLSDHVDINYYLNKGVTKTELITAALRAYENHWDLIKVTSTK